MNPNDITDIKPPIDLPPDLTWAWVMLGLIVLALVIFVYKKCFVKKQPQPQPVITQTPYEKAMGQLKELYAKQLFQQGLVKEYFDGISIIVRVYVEESIGIHAPLMSSEEFLSSLQGSFALSEGHKALLNEMLRIADLVKFAKHKPSINEAETFYRHALDFVEECRRV